MLWKTGAKDFGIGGMLHGFLMLLIISYNFLQYFLYSTIMRHQNM